MVEETKKEAEGKKECSCSAAASQEKEQESVGTILRRARLAKKQDLHDIASYLCIRYQFLEAIEQGRQKELPGETYAAGFVRSYAAYLGLNAPDIVSQYKTELNVSADKKRQSAGISEPETENMGPSGKTIFISVVLLLAAYGFWTSFSTTKDIEPEYTAAQTKVIAEEAYPLTPSEETVPVNEAAETPAAVETVPAAPVSTPVPAAAPVPAPVAVPVSAAVSAPAMLEKPVDVAEVKTPVPAVVPVVAPAVPVPAAKAQPVQQKTDNPVVETRRIYGQKNNDPRVVLIANEKTWIEISKGDSVLVSRTLNKGDRYQASRNSENVFLKTGNAGGLDIFVDGKQVPAIGPRGATRMKVSLDADYLSPKAVEQN